MELSLDITHSWIGDLRISLHSPEGTEVILHGRSGREKDNIVKTYTFSNTPALGELEGELISGDWRLHISDHQGADLGKLNEWRIGIYPAT